MPVVSVVFPFLELGQGVETLGLTALADFDDGSDELLQEWELQQTGPVVVDEVDDETLDVGTVLVLISHDHQFAITKTLQVIHALVLLLILQPNNFHLKTN